MSSAINNPNPWGTYNSYKDCSQGICSIYCPQWCYIIFPPPPPVSLEDESGTDFSPLIIAVIGVLASAFILVSYYTIISKYCRRRRSDSGLEFSENRDQMTSNEASQQGNNNIGLDEALIKSITVCKYKKGAGLVEGTDCSVCLSEFQEDESLRLLPKCSHAFHLPCIDTWLKSHSSCPLCRANITSTNTLPRQAADAVQEAQPDLNVSMRQYQHRDESVSVIHDIENGVAGQEAIIVGIVVSEDAAKTQTDHGENLGERGNAIEVGVDHRPIVRSASFNSSVRTRAQGPVLVADILRDNNDDDYQMESIEKSRSSRVMTMVRSPLALKRTVSTGRFMSTRYGKAGNSFIDIPNN